MGERDAIGRVNIKRLGQCRAGASLSGITNVSDAKSAQQLRHVAGAEDISHQALALTLH